MTTSDGIQSKTREVSTLEEAVNAVPAIDDAPAEEPDSAPPAPDRPPLGDHPDRPRHRRLPRWQTISDHEISLDRTARLRVLTCSLIGAGCLLLAHRLQSSDTSPFAAPSGAVAWIALIAGIAGVWLIPGLWLSAVMMRSGIGPAARLATRIGTTLAWYVLVGPVIHFSADEARVTSGGIVGVTVAATAAVCLGVALGLVRQPKNPWLRVLTAALIGGACAQTVIWLALLFSSDGVDYEQIRRLNWLILLASALFTAIGAQNRPELPIVRTARHIRVILISLAVVAVTALALFATGSVWSPAQRLPSAIGIEQVATPPGADVAFALTTMGPDGPALIQRAAFTASDDTGRPVAVSTRLLMGGNDDPPTLLVVLDPVSRPQLCEHSAATLGAAVAGDSSQHAPPVKLTVRDQASGTLVQAVIPPGWCVL
jgi:hypothetical protein